MISILCPTRGRIPEFTRMLQSLRDVKTENVEVLAYVDDDDPQRDEYLTYGRSGFGEIPVKIKVGPRIVLTKCWNEVLPLAKADIFMQCNDDVIFRTPGWERTVEQAFSEAPDHIILAYGSDGTGGHEGRFGPHPFVHRRWVETIGYFIPPYFSSDFGDAWVNELGEALDRVKRLPIEIEHMHFIFGKAQKDQTTEERLQRHKKDEPGKIYDAMAQLRELDIKKLQGATLLSDEAFAGRMTIRPKLDILILTQYSRAHYLHNVLEILGPQVKWAAGEVDIKVEMFEPAQTLGDNRERLRQRSTAEYICFVDDDDLVAPNYVQKILQKLDGVDYIGFNVQTYIDGKPLKLTSHSLKHGGVRQDETGNYRDISHINPMRRELALAMPMSGWGGEDGRWADDIRKLGIVRSEHFINETLYTYDYRSRKEDAAEYHQRNKQKREDDGKPRQAPLSYCPNCNSPCTQIFCNGRRCQQCGFQWGGPQ